MGSHAQRDESGERGPAAGVVVETNEQAALVLAKLPPGSLPPLFGPEDLDDPKLCDDDQWPHIESMFERFEADGVRVDESDWMRRGAGTRAGIASFLSKCRFGGGTVTIRAANGAALQVYDPARGLRDAS